MPLERPSPEDVERYAPGVTPFALGALSRADRRRMNRAAGHKGSKSKRNKRPALTRAEMETMTAQRAEQEKIVKSITAARSMRDRTGGRLWLPGDQL